jgi:CRISPR system Cascade subunit CasB
LVYLAAGLWASAPRREPGKAHRIGEAWRVLHGRQDSKRSTEARFVSLIGADEDELNWRLRQATKLLSSASIDIDWPMLLRHLLGWSHPDRWVQQSWARDFWRDTDAAATDTAAASATEQA